MSPWAPHAGQLSPRLNLVTATDQTSVHAGYARYFTPPPLELAQTPQPQPLRQYDQRTGGHRRFSDPFGTRALFRPRRIPADHADLNVSLDGYYKRATQQLDEGQFGAALIYAAFNYEVGHIYGAELSANYTHGGFSAYANASLGHADGETIDSGQFEFGADELAYIATHQVHLDHDQDLTGSAGASYRWGGNLAYLDFLYASGLRSGFANTDHVAETTRSIWARSIRSPGTSAARSRCAST